MIKSMPHKFKKIVLLETLSNESFDKYKNIQSWKQSSKRKKKVFYVTKCLLTYLLTFKLRNGNMALYSECSISFPV
jgi:hypothetical protein